MRRLDSRHLFAKEARIQLFPNRKRFAMSRGQQIRRDAIRRSRLPLTLTMLCAGILALSSRSSADTITSTIGYAITPPAGFDSATANAAFGGMAAGAAYLPKAPLTSQVYSHAILWDTNGVPYDLQPTGSIYNSSRLAGIGGDYQIGTATYPYSGGAFSQAVLWHGSASQYVVLTSPEFQYTVGYGISRDGAQQVGFGRSVASNNTDLRALVWNSSGTDYADLSSPEFLYSTAFGANDGYQVGGAALPSSNEHAMLWHGTAQSVIDLNPAGYTSSRATVVSGNQQGGIVGTYPFSQHAAIWEGTADSFVDLNPTGYGSSEVTALFNDWQIGNGNTSDGRLHALIWHGSADSVIDLQAVLPNSIKSSFATSMDGDYVYGFGFDLSGQLTTITWHVPEPGSLSLLACCGLGLLGRRARH